MPKHGKGGRPRLPDETKKLKGTLRKDRTAKQKPVFTGKADCPPWLGERAALEWERVAPQLERLGMLTVADLAMFAAYCQAFGDYVDLTVEIGNLEATTFKTPKGHMQSIPQVTQRREAYRQMKECAREFGFTPASRSGIDLMIETGEVDEPDTPTGRKIKLI